MEQFALNHLRWFSLYDKVQSQFLHGMSKKLFPSCRSISKTEATFQGCIGRSAPAVTNGTCTSRHVISSSSVFSEKLPSRSPLLYSSGLVTPPLTQEKTTPV